MKIITQKIIAIVAPEQAADLDAVLGVDNEKSIHEETEDLFSGAATPENVGELLEEELAEGLPKSPGEDSAEEEPAPSPEQTPGDEGEGGAELFEEASIESRGEQLLEAAEDELEEEEERQKGVGAFPY